MLHEKYLAWGHTKNCMRELSAYGNARKLVIGAENVYDYGLGNPSVPAPESVAHAIAEVNAAPAEDRHAYPPNAGLPEYRRAVAEDLNARFGLDVLPELVYAICGANAGLAICCHGLLRPGDEVILLAPYFTEYSVFVESARAVAVHVPPDERMQPDLDAFARAITKKTRIVLVNTPCNPSGVVLSEETLRGMAALLSEAQARYGRPIYLVTDEPYREVIYDRESIPAPMKFYDNAIMCYSFSKALSLPGERIGYLVVGPHMAEREAVFKTLAETAVTLGYRSAPVTMQRALARCMGQTVDISVYKRNRDLLYQGLTALGFRCIEPEGTFYLFMQSPEPDAKQCSERAKKYELLLVPSDDFGVTGWLRLAYCVPTDMIERSMPAFRKLAEEYGLC